MTQTGKQWRKHGLQSTYLAPDEFDSPLLTRSMGANELVTMVRFGGYFKKGAGSTVIHGHAPGTARNDTRATL